MRKTAGKDYDVNVYNVNRVLFSRILLSFLYASVFNIVNKLHQSHSFHADKLISVWTYDPTSTYSEEKKRDKIRALIDLVYFYHLEQSCSGSNLNY